MKQIGLKSYQDIKTPPKWDEPSISDYFEMFYSEYCGKKDYSDEDYEIIRRWWYEFKGGTGCPYNEDIDTTLEEMKEQLADFDARREHHTCETCERCINGVCEELWKHNCRIGNNDDYTMIDYYRKRMSREDWEWLLCEKRNKITDLSYEKYKLKKENEQLKDQIADIKANCDLAIEGRDVKIKELEEENAELKADNDARKFAMAMSEKVEKQLREQIEKMKRHCNCKHRDGEGYCEVKRTYLMDLSYDGCDKWELED